MGFVLFLLSITCTAVIMLWLSDLPHIRKELKGLRRDLRRMRFRRVKLSQPVRLTPKDPQA